MATIVLGSAGAATGNPVLAFAGAAIGSYIDNRFLFPLIFPKDPIRGPRLADLSVQTASEGDPLKWIIGPYNRIGGTIIWKTPLVEHKKTTSVGGKGGPGEKIENFTYSANFAVALCDTQFAGTSFRMRKVWADTTVIYDDGDTDAYVDLAFYDGTQTEPDSFIESVKGVGLVPAYKKIAYVRFQELALADHGNRIPNITVWLEQSNDVSLADAYSMLLQRAGFDPSEFDVSRLNQCFKGLVVSGPQPTIEVLQQVMVAYGTTLTEHSGKLVFRRRGQERVHQVPSSKLAAHEVDDDAPRIVRLRDRNDTVVPREVNVRYVDWQRSMLQGAVRSRRHEHPSDHVVTLDFPISFDKAEASGIADTILWSAEAERQAAEISLPPSMVDIKEGDAISIDDGEYYIFLQNIERGFNFQHIARGVLMQPHTYEFIGIEISTPTVPGAYVPPETTGHVMDLPALIDAHATRVGLYYAACATDPEAAWRGAFLYESSDDVAFNQVANIPVEATIGIVQRGPDEGPTFFTDRANKIIVELLEGTLTSVSQEEFFSGANVCAIQTRDGDWEIIAFQTATLIEGSTYELSTLIRGMRGTDVAVGRHSIIGAPFVLLNLTGSVGFHEAGLSGLGADRFYRFIPARGTIADFESSEQTLTGRSVRCMPVTHLEHVFSDETAIVSGTPGLGVQGTDKFIRTDGSFITDGFKVGMSVVAAGFYNDENSGAFLITAVSALSLTVDAVLAAETTASASVTGAPNMGVTTQNRFNRAAGSFITDGFETGMKVVTAGFTDPANNGTFTVIEVTASNLKVQETLVVEASGAGRTIDSTTKSLEVQAGDLTVRWVRRSRRVGWMWSGAGLLPDEDPEQYEIDFFAGGAKSTVFARTKAVSSSAVTYTASEQTADGYVPGKTAFAAEVYQMSTETSRGVGNRIHCVP